MFIDCDLRKLDEAFEHFIQATGVYASLLNEDFSYRLVKNNPHNKYCERIEACSEGTCACRESDRKLLERCRSSQRVEMHICHAGLVDVAAPILYDGHVLGYIILGQIKQEPDFQAVAHRLEQLPLDLDEMEAYYRQLPCCSAEKTLGVANLAVMLARYLFMEEIIKPGVERGMAEVLEYIDRNLSEPLSVERISESTNVSPSTLYRYFHRYFHCTVSEYITEKRLKWSATLLRSTALSMEQVSQQTGFSSAAYFSRLFKKQYGIAPLQYRKQQKGTANN